MGIVGVFYMIPSMIGYGLSSGMQILMSRRAGEGDKEMLSKILTNGVMFTLFFALALMVVSLLFAPIIFGLSLKNIPHIILSINFIYIRVWGLPFLFLTQLFNAFFISLSKSKYIIWGSVATTITNIIFDYLLVLGHGGFPKMGLQGAAIASVIAEIVYFITMVGIFYFQKMHWEYPLRFYTDFSIEICKKTIRIALPLIVQFMFSIGGWEVFFIFIEHLGNKELAASQILRNTFGIVGMVTWAFAATCSTMVSNVIGQGRQDEVIGLIKKIAKISFIVTLILNGTLLIFARQFLSIYTADTALVDFALPSLRVIVIATVLMSFSSVTFNGVVGTGKTMVNLIMEVTCVCTYLLYCYFVIEKWKSPLYLCWGSEFVYWFSLIIVSTLYLKSGRWKNKHI